MHQGPYFLAKSLNLLGGFVATRSRIFPKMGSFHGPGGIFLPKSYLL